MLAFRAKYYSKRSAVRQRYGLPDGPTPPPDLPRTGPVELTPRLERWLMLHCEEPDLMPALYAEEDRPLRIVTEAWSANGKGSKRQKQQQYWV